MFQQFGQKIRTVRQQRGIGLNALAKKLDISPAYLSNLENGKTETIHLSFLKQLEDELGINPSDLFEIQTEEQDGFNEFHFRTEKALQALSQLEEKDPQFADYLLSIVEQGIALKEPRDYH